VSPRPRRALLAAVVVATAVGLNAGLATAKEDVEATLLTPVGLDAAPGKEITVAWTLESVDARGKREPFGASGIYLRLLSAGDGKPTVAPATGGNGRYEATAIVPEGGVGRIRIGLQGWVSDANGTHRRDAFFRITNNPLAAVTATTAAAPHDPAPASLPDSSSTVSPLWIAALAFALVGAVVGVIALLRRRRDSAAV
jgi:hypothetical protein